MPSVLVTGANRGIGLAFARSYAEDGWRTFAACREPQAARALAELADGDRVSLHRLDVTSEDSVAGLARDLDGEPIDVLINNAGIGEPGPAFGGLDYDKWMRTLAVNTLGPVRVSEALRPHVVRSTRRVIAAVTSGLGSIGDNTSGGFFAYRSSKAALNMAFRSLAHELQPDGIAVVVVNPGWVRTDMGGPQGTLAPGQSVQRLRQILDEAGPAQSGRFLNHDGKELPW